MTTKVSKTDILVDVAAARRYVADNWGWFLALGIVLVLAGIAAIAFPLVSTIATKIFLGWLFLIGGAMMIAHAFSVHPVVGPAVEPVDRRPLSSSSAAISRSSRSRAS